METPAERWPEPRTPSRATGGRGTGPVGQRDEDPAPQPQLGPPSGASPVCAQGCPQLCCSRGSWPGPHLPVGSRAIFKAHRVVFQEARRKQQRRVLRCCCCGGTRPAGMGWPGVTSKSHTQGRRAEGPGLWSCFVPPYQGGQRPHIWENPSEPRSAELRKGWAMSSCREGWGEMPSTLPESAPEWTCGPGWLH